MTEDNGPKGLGDGISWVIKKVTRGKVKECEPCRKRRVALNKLVPLPFKKKEKNDGG